MPQSNDVVDVSGIAFAMKKEWLRREVFKLITEYASSISMDQLLEICCRRSIDKGIVKQAFKDYIDGKIS